MRQIVLGLCKLRLIRPDLPKVLCALGRKDLNYRGIAYVPIAADKQTTVHLAIVSLLPKAGALLGEACR